MNDDTILKHADFVRGLARSLVADEHQAEDAAQEAWLAALERPPRSAAALRSWLGSVVRNALRNATRSARRRRRRERSVAIPEICDDAGWLHEREQILEAVVAAVRELRPPQRTVILLRFYEGLPPRTIASRLEEPVETVRTRLKRALAELRGRLDRVHGGDRRAWRVALAPLAGLPTNAAAKSGFAAGILAGVLAMNTTLKSFTLIALIASALLLMHFGLRSPVDTPGSASGTNAVASTAGGGGDQAEEDAVIDRTPVRTPLSTGIAAPAAVARLAGRVLDIRGGPVGGVTVSIGKLDACSDGLGCFEFNRGDSRERPVVAAPFVLVRSGRTESGKELLLVVATRVDISAVVTDEAGLPLAGALVELRSVPLVDFPEIIDRTRRPDLGAGRTDAKGRLELPALAAGCTALRLGSPGYETRIIKVTAALAGAQRFALRPLATELHVLTGTVLDHCARVVPGALVALGPDNRVRTDETGFFRIEYVADEIPPAGRNLVAAKRGHRTKVIAGFGAKPEHRRRQRDIEIRLDGPTLEIAGQLLHADGEFWAGARILLWQQEYVTGTSTAEELAMTGEALPLVGLVPQALGQPCTTDEQGRFTLGGLSDRSYRLRILDMAAGLAMTTRPIAAGRSGVVIRIPANPFRATLRGRVVDPSGKAMPGVRVICSVWVVHNSDNHAMRTVEDTRTSAAGEFELHKVCRLDPVRIRALGEGILDRCRILEPAEAVQDLTLVVERRCHFRVELANPSLAHAIRILDARGERLQISYFGHTGGDQGFRNTPLPLRDGKTPVVSASERACTLELVGKSKRRMPIRLVPGQITVLRF